MARRAEDMVRRMTGMPSRKEEQKRQRQQEKQRRRQERRQRPSADNDTYGIRSMQEYAVDVEYTETKEYSESDILEEDGRQEHREYHESQVSDVEYVEIKDRKD